MVVGTCSICGGAVTVPDVFWSIYPPIPTCSNCGAHKKNAYGPVIDMEPVTTYTTTGPDILQMKYCKNCGWTGHCEKCRKKKYDL